MPLSSPRYPPGPRGHPLLGHLPALRREQIGFLERCAREYGDFVPLRLGPTRAFLLSHPDLVEPVFVSHLDRFNRGPGAERNRRMFGRGLIASEGDLWRRHRRLAQPSFQREPVAVFGPVMVTCAERVVASWQDGETRDIHHEMTRLTLEIVVRFLFGRDADTIWHTQGEAIAAAMNLLPQTLLRRLNGPLLLLPEAFPAPTNWRMGRALADLDRILYPLIQQSRNRQGNEGGGLLERLVAARDEGDGAGLTDEEIRDELVTFLFAGHETTAATLTWACSLLARHPTIQTELAAELQTVLGDRSPRVEDRPALVQTERIVMETLRLYPPAWILGRGVKQPCEIGGCSVPPHSTVLMSPWVMQRDRRFFDAPERFDPRRWADGLARRLPKFAFYPFGGGPRVCIGQSFATQEAALVLAVVARGFHFEPATGPLPAIQPAITLRPEGGLLLRLCRRAAGRGHDHNHNPEGSLQSQSK
jgi:cytochrome P450